MIIFYMKRVIDMSINSIDIDTKIKGIYLNSETIDLLKIIECKSTQELQQIVKDCEQLNGKQYNLNDSNIQLDDIKKYIIKDYQDVLETAKNQAIDRKKVSENALRHCGIKDEDIDKYYIRFLTERF